MVGFVGWFELVGSDDDAARAASLRSLTGRWRQARRRDSSHLGGLARGPWRHPKQHLAFAATCEVKDTYLTRQKHLDSISGH